MHPSDTTDTPPRPEIALSWRRSELSGLTPAAPEIRVDPDAVDRRGRLATAAGPVLTELADQLGDASFCVVLADRASRIVAPTVGPRGLRNRLEELGVVAGGVFLEETTGTNSIATVYEVRRGLAVHGDEHYLEPFKRFSCYGHPIIHPVTRRLEGVLDITCLTGDGSPLLGPFLARAAHDVEERLLRTTRAAEQRLLAAFQVAAAGRTLPLLVLGEGVVLANPAAVELLDPLDHLLLRELAAGLPARDGTVPARRVELVSGRSVEVRPRSLGPGTGGVLFEFTVPAETRSAPAPAPARPGARSRSGTPVYIGGAPGTGRTTRARALAGAEDGPAVVLDSSEAAVRGEAAWLRDLDRAAGGPGPLLLEEVQLLPEACAVRLRHLLERPAGPDSPRIVLTGAPAGDLDGPGAALAAACAGRIDLTPLRDRTEELPGLVRAVLDELGADPGPRFTPAALAVLAGHPWPGNLRELRAVVRAVLERRSAGDVTPGDLPEGYRVSPRLRRMTPLERAEHDTIAAALRACGGNKLRTARRLGISRTTLYNRMRALHITS
ncbi:dihydroxyacetone kinase operon transcriptional regulator DhaR [Streptomyces amakusaensis]|uniref:Sigma-54-dependent Fis family transcriptional regulator n=1 Tax=Streptomyces amakusaensis TaxID=67271 RepID=A0ABW0AS75_9ACTN